MASGTKSAIIIFSVLGAFIFVCGGGGYLAYQLFLGSLSNSRIPIQMHNPGQLAPGYYVDHTILCRLRIPSGNVTIDDDASMFKDVEGGFAVRQDNRTIVVMMFDRKSYSFDTFVKLNRLGLKHSNSVTNVRILNEGRSEIAGMEAYVMQVHCVVKAQEIQGEVVCVDAPDKKVYMLFGMTKDVDWNANADVIDSSLSTFEVGSFPDDAQRAGSHLANVPNVPNNPPQQWANGNPMPPPPMPLPPRPQPPAQHLTFESVPDALTYLQTGRPDERRAALSYIERSAPDPALHDRVMPELIRLAGDANLHTSALNAVKSWADKSDAPALRGELDRRVQMDPNGRSNDTLEERKMLMGLLAGDGDEASARSMAQSLRNPGLRSDAEDALTILGAAGEPAIDEMVANNDADTAREAMKLLSTMGTKASILPLQKISYGPKADLASAANQAIEKIAARENLNPEDYQYNLIKRYVIEPPPGFTLDAMATPNVRQWSRAAPGRAVRSVLRVSVQPVPRGYMLRPAPGSNVVAAGTIEFHQMDANSTAASKSVHYVAVDGDFLIDLVATMDNADSSAGNLLTASVKKIHAAQ